MNNNPLKISRRKFLAITAIAAFALAFIFSPMLFAQSRTAANKFHFTIVSDCHMSNGNYNFEKFMLPAIMKNLNGPGVFMVDTGDMDPFENVYKAIQTQVIAPSKAQGKTVGWYPIPGNHDLYNTSNDATYKTETPEKSQTHKLVAYNKKQLKNIINWGPEFKSKLIGYENNAAKYTTYSFDYENSHFVMLDLFYCNEVGPRGCGNFHKVTEKWLKRDLEQNKKKNIFIFGHHPIIAYTGSNGKKMPKNDLLNFHKKRFWRVLKKYHVNAYFCGHTHLYGVVEKDGVTQICNGSGARQDSGSYIMVFIDGDKITYKTYLHTSGKWQELTGTLNREKN